MVHGDGPAPVTAFSRLLIGIAMLLCLTLPLCAQSSDPAVATQDLLKQCEKVFLVCADACRNAPSLCSICEKERAQCRAEVYSTAAVPKPRIRGITVQLPTIPGSIPLIPGISTPTTPRPYPSPSTPVIHPAQPKPVPQDKEYCGEYEQILARYRAKNAPSADVLGQTIESEQGELAQKIADAQAKVDAAGWFSKRGLKKELDKLKKLDAFLTGAAKLLGTIDPNAPNRDTILIGLKLTIERVLANGDLLPLSVSTKETVGKKASHTEVIDANGASYPAKQNALGHLLSQYGAGQNPQRLAELAERVGKDSVIASCRGEAMGRPTTAKADEPPGKCNGKSYDATQCCTGDGIGTPVKTTKESILSCPPEKRSPNPKSVAKTNGCGSDDSNDTWGDRFDNPCWFRSWNHSGPCTMPSFVPACDFHDKCWGTCNTSRTGTSQQVCDSEFGSRIGQICEAANLSDQDLEDCHYWAGKYQEKVGEATEHYNESQAEACVCCEGAK
jgi:hypothetical protein